MPLRTVHLDPMSPADLAWAQGLVGDTLSLAAPETADAPLAPLLADAEAIVSRGVPVTAAILAQAPRLRLVQKYGGRADGIDRAAARARGVTVATMPLVGTIAVAELAMTLILALSKQLVMGHHATVTGAYRELGVEPKVTSQRVIAFQWMKLPHLLEVYGHTLGIIGFGEIGTETARRARAFGMRVLYTKRTRLDADMEQALGVTYATLDDVLRQSDFVLLATPHTPDTDRLMGARELALMKPTAYLVNICRGGVVDEDALVAALRERRIRGAGLDVFVQEPIPYDHPLLQLDNVILTPHIGGGTGGARERQMRDVLGNVVRLARGEMPLHVVA